MIVYPAIDMLGGKCVRLAQGRFDDATVYADDPAAALRDFAAKGAGWVHVVDLDGARAGTPVQHRAISSLAGDLPLRIQLAGGFRTRGQVAGALDAGIARVVIGTLAVEQPDTVHALIAAYGSDRLTLALDVDLSDGTPRLATSGWQKSADTTLWAAAREFSDARHILVTDIGRDGMMTGPNLDLAREIGQRFPALALQSSGGVARLDDIAALAGIGVAGVITGKALWEGRFTLEQALRHAGA